MKIKFDEKKSFLKEVSLKEIPRVLKIKDKGIEQKTLKFRSITPEAVDGHWQFEGDILPSLLRIREKIQDENRARYEQLLRMIKFHRLFPPREQMRGTRKFHVDWTRPQAPGEPSTWYEIAKRVVIKDAMDFIMLATQNDKIPPSSEELLKKAIYRQPTLEIPFSRESYKRFRELHMRRWEAYDSLVVKVGVPKMLRGEKDPLLDKMRNKNLRGYEKARKSPEESEKFILRQIFKNELEDQEEKAQRYGPILEKATNLYRKYLEKSQGGKNVLANRAFSDEFDSLMNAHIAQCEGDTKRRKLLAITKDEIRTVRKEAYIDFLKQSIASKDVRAKWSGLVKLIENLIYEGNAIRLIEREAEKVCLGLIHYGINEIYRKIRKNLTVPEKRAFILAHYQQYKVLGKSSPVFPFGGRIPRLDPIIWDFFTETGETTQALVYSVLVFKYPPSARLRKRYVEKLIERWNRYLWFYPIWEGIERQDDRDRKRQEVWEKRTISLETLIQEDKEGHTLPLGDILQSEGPERQEIVFQIIDERFPPEEAEILKLRFKGYTLQQIGKMVGKSREAIRKTILKAREKILEGS